MKIYVIQAQEIAEQEMRRVVTSSPRLAQYKFDELYLRREEPLFWTFGVSSPQIFDEGYAPGALFVSIDKLDGRIWSDEEVTLYYEQRTVATKQLRCVDVRENPSTNAGGSEVREDQVS